MSETAAPPPADADSPADQEYFRALEEKVVALRGAAILLSPADWQLARSWRARAIPIEVVCGALDLCAQRLADRHPGRRISSLRYCRAAVSEAWEEVEALGAAEAGRRREALVFDPAPRLAALAAALPESLHDRERRAAALAALSGPAPEIEAALAELERAWLKLEWQRIEPGTRAAIEGEVERSLAALAGRFAAEELLETRAALARETLRRRLGVPKLSLFAAE